MIITWTTTVRKCWRLYWLYLNNRPKKWDDDDGDNLVFTSLLTLFYLISTWWCDSNERLCPIKHYIFKSWTLVLVGFKLRAWWSAQKTDFSHGIWKGVMGVNVSEYSCKPKVLKMSNLLMWLVYWANSADNKLVIVFLIFSRKQVLTLHAYCLHERCPMETICMKCQILFSGEI